VSNYESPQGSERVQVIVSEAGLAYGDPEAEPQREVKCNACYGTGLVEVHGQETDCIECGGYGTVLV
jgi:hypothetical protein